MTDISAENTRELLQNAEKEKKKRRPHNPRAKKNVYSWGEKPSDDGVPAKLFSKFIRFIFWKALPGLIATYLCASVFLPELRVTRHLPKMDFANHGNVEMYARAAVFADEDHPCAQAIDAAYEKMESGKVNSTGRDSEAVLADLDEGCASDARNAMGRSTLMAQKAKTSVHGDQVRIASTANLPDSMRDCENCPELVRITAGSGISIRGELSIVKQDFYLGRSEVSIAEYQQFLTETERNAGKKCFTYERASWKARKRRDHTAPGYDVQVRQPASCVSFADAQAYVKWLSGKTGQVYRLPTLHEWARAAGSDWQNAGKGCRSWNAADYSSSRVYPSLKPNDCDDNHAATADAGLFVQGPFSLSNLSGNVWEWVVDRDIDKKGNWATVIGGSWATGAGDMSVASLSYTRQKTKASNIGFRVVRELPEKQVNESGLRLRCLRNDEGDQC